MANGDTKTESYLRAAAEGTRADLPTDTCCNTKTQNLILGVANRIMDVEDEVEELKNNPDVVDIVATYAALQAYDTQHLTDNDVVRVLQDETHNGDSTYYRFTKNPDTWTYIGESKQYTNFVGTDGQTAGVAGLVPAPATTDAGKFLKADGTWETVQAGPTVVQATGTSTTDVMSQNAVSTELFNDPATKEQVKIGSGSGSIGTKSLAIGSGAGAAANYGVAIGRDSSVYTGANSGIAIGNYAKVAGEGGIAMSTAYSPNNAVANGLYSVAISRKAQSSGHSSIAIGNASSATKNGAIALGSFSSATNVGEMNIGSSSTSQGYNSSNYRLLSGVHDPVNAHDAATKGYVDANAGSLTYFTSVYPDNVAEGVTLYSDSAHTTPISLATFFSALRNGKTVWLEYRTGDGEYDARNRYQIVTAFLTNVDTQDAYDEVAPSAMYYTTSGARYLRAWEFDPTATTGAFEIGS